MMLTKKGSTRGTVSSLFLAALIFLCARSAVSAIETFMPDKSRQTVAWKPIPNVLTSKNRDVYLVDDLDTSSKDYSTVSDSIAPRQSKDKSEAAKMEGLPADSSAHPPVLDASSSKPAEEPAKKKPRKRFAVEKIFPDNVRQLPLFIFFADDGSAISQKMENTALASKEIREKIEKEYFPIKIRFDKKLSKTEYRLYQEFGSTAVPIVSIRSWTGEHLAYGTGYLSAVKIMVLMKNAERKQTELDEKPTHDSD